MPRREILTPSQRVQLFAFPDDEGELIRRYTLTKADLAFVRQHRGDHNRLGIAVQMCSLRFPGRVMGENERPHDRLLNLMATQLGISIVAWDLYAQRDETRREHLLELLSRLGLEQFGTKHYRAISAWLESTALQTTQGIVLAQTVVDELRRRLVVLPSLTVIERLCAEVATRAERKIFALLTADLTTGQRMELDRLLELREGSPYSVLAWLRLPPGAPTAKAILAHIERLRAIRNLDLSAEISRKVHQNRLLQLAREGGQTAVYQLKEYEPDRRHATLVALMIETAATLTDEALDLHDRLIGSFFTKSKNKYERTFAEQGQAINDKVLRQMNREGSRKVPSNAPTGFIRKRWKSFVFTAEGIDRRFYELCVMAELKNAMRSGDVSVSGSRQFRAFEEYLMPHAEFNERFKDGRLHFTVSTSGAGLFGFTSVTFTPIARSNQFACRSRAATRCRTERCRTQDQSVG
jgi:TnpA family transposase